MWSFELPAQATARPVGRMESLEEGDMALLTFLLTTGLVVLLVFILARILSRFLRHATGARSRVST